MSVRGPGDYSREAINRGTPIIRGKRGTMETKPHACIHVHCQIETNNECNSNYMYMYFKVNMVSSMDHKCVH